MCVTKSSSLVNNQCIHYSYLSLLFGTVGKILTSPSQSPCVGVILPNLLDSLDMSLSQLTLLYMFATATSAFLLPFSSRLLTSMPINRSALLLHGCLGLSCLTLSCSSSWPAVLLSLFCLRFFGQGNLFNLSVVFINQWWVDSRGTAIGVAGASVSAAMLGLVPVVMLRLIDAYTWRGCYRVLSGVLFSGGAAAWALWGGPPEAYGMLPDAKRRVAGGKREVPADENLQEPSYSSPTFLCYVLSDLIMACTGTAFFFNLRQVLMDQGLDAIEGVIYPLMAVMGIIGRIVTGRAIDQHGHRHIFTCSLLANALGLAAVPFSTSTTFFLAAPLLGLAMAAAGNIRSTVHAAFYGRKNLGKVQSAASSATVLGSAIGPFPWGLCRDLTGAFDGAFLVGAAVSLLAAAAVWRFGRNPNQKKSTEYELVGRRSSNVVTGDEELDLDEDDKVNSV
mmetsp:Transcript_7506/g.14860  ORF Transcript_7506/g.14860 Transcript_7506/m.14860 type:complete len:449 (+) Transcript_7506:232-1578(+)|eukprot:CAMPEP_0182479766 /NCGR_PEP_ID=MMETSP1319-20130603/34730_1 /TAXON_ID=172717 /ORGANISM="Bolidomonas pacifica, Strain RCC208" /LENGTH=448 /DNA_ID=CAMNT_0024681205 /DNA_START=177 /DNA_END=1523 /DNA_ORIENTATION=+